MEQLPAGRHPRRERVLDQLDDPGRARRQHHLRWDARRPDPRRRSVTARSRCQQHRHGDRGGHRFRESAAGLSHESNALFGNVTNYAGAALPGEGYVLEDCLLDDTVTPPSLGARVPLPRRRLGRSRLAARLSRHVAWRLARTSARSSPSPEDSDSLVGCFLLFYSVDQSISKRGFSARQSARCASAASAFPTAAYAFRAASWRSALRYGVFRARSTTSTAASGWPAFS